jgi:dienelactone hydrolase
VYTVDPTLPNHTVYLPKPVPAGLKLPVVVWGEGGCSGNGTDVVEFLSEISSHGFMVLALGKPNGTGTTTAQMMTDAVDWVTSAKALARYGYVDASRIAAAGFSCGGMQAYNVSGDARVKALGIFNSGLMGEAESKRVATTITKPIFYFLGGPSDIAYANVSTHMPGWVLSAASLR